MSHQAVMRVLFTVGVFLLTLPLGYGQTLLGDLDRISNHLDSAKSVSLKVKIAVHEKKDAAAFYRTEASIVRKGLTSVTVLGDVEIFDNDQYRVDVDKEEKTVAIIRKSELKQQLKNAGMEFDMQSLSRLLQPEKGKKQPYEARLITSDNNMHTYSVTNLQGIREMKVILDMQALSIKSVSYQYAEESAQKGQYIEIEYTGFLINREVTVNGPSDYFLVSDKKYRLSKRFAGYTLITE